MTPGHRANGSAPRIVGLLRVRDEEAILADALDHMAAFCDGGIYVYDDVSTDASPRICRAHPAVADVISGAFWDPNRGRAEYQHRAALLARVRRTVPGPAWLVYLDADERIEFDWTLLDTFSDDVLGVRMKLFDFYITAEDEHAHHTHRRWIGPEYRTILMAFRNAPTLSYSEPDQREVDLGRNGTVVEAGYVRHYGKAVSVGQWESTCDYYIAHFPGYSAKWKARKGRAIHSRSDFGRDLIMWHQKDELGIPLTPGDHAAATPDPGASGPACLEVLVTNHQMMGYAGSEVFTYTVALFLKRLGHSVTVYSRYVDKFASPLRAHGIRVVTSLAEVRDVPFDVAHVHHNINALEVRHHFPTVPIILVSHGVLPSLEQPPVLDLHISRFLAVSEEVRDHLAARGVDPGLIEILRNPVDSTLFSPAGPASGRPQRALVVSARLDPGREQVIRDAFSILDIQARFVGGRFGEVEPSLLPVLINRADIVFSLGRGAIEAMMCGRVPFIFDYLGADGLVTIRNVGDIMRCNFSGRRHRREMSAEEVANELRRYRSDDGARLREFAVAHFDAASQVRHLVGVYDAVRRQPVDRLTAPDSSRLAQFVQMIDDTRGYSTLAALQPHRREMQALAFRTVPGPRSAGSEVEAGAAVAALRDQLWLDENDAATHEELGRVYYAQGKVEEAIARFGRALDLDPGRASASKSLSLVALELLTERDHRRIELEARVASLKAEVDRWRNAYFESHMRAFASTIARSGVKSVAVFGAGESGRALVNACRELGIEIPWLADGRQDLWGSEVCGLRVSRLEDALAARVGTFAVASLGSAERIRTVILAAARAQGRRVKVLRPATAGR